MKIVKIVRIETHPEEGTFGVMTVNGSASFLTLEPYSRDNISRVSCIPTGQYICKRYSSEGFPNTFNVTNVAHRNNILFHTGNIDDNTLGCIILGSEFGFLKGKRAVLESRKAFDKFMNMLETEDSFKLTIVEEF